MADLGRGCTYMWEVESPCLVSPEGVAVVLAMISIVLVSGTSFFGSLSELLKFSST